MNKPKRRKATVPEQETIDQRVVSQADDDSAWEPRVEVKKSKPTSLSIPGDLAARAAFLARVHREPGLNKWVERVLRERVELEELAFNEAKRKVAS